MANADSIVTLLERVDEQPIRTAFEPLASMSYTRRRRVEQINADGERIAFDERIERHLEDGWEEVDADSSGTFDFGFLRRFSGDAETEDLPASLPRYVIPDDPAYASRRTLEAFTYSAVRPETLDGTPVRRISIQARPGIGDDQSIRRAQLYLDEEDDVLVAIHIERIESALWFREESSLFLHIERLGTDQWVPREVRFEVLLKLPLRSPQQFRHAAEYYDFRERRAATSL